MKGGYQSLVGITDKNGKQYACHLDDIKESGAVKRALSEEERSPCLDVSELVGTERWKTMRQNNYYPRRGE